MTLERVAIAIPSWNGREHLETCLGALAELEGPGVEWDTWVYDNASRDGTAEWLEREHPEVRVLRSPVNRGFAAALNAVVDEAEECQAIAFLNNDTRPRRDWLRELVGTMARAPEDVAAVSGRIVDWDGSRLDFGRGLVTFDGHALQEDFRRPIESARIPEPGEELLFACGGNMLVRREVFRELGGFDEDFFAYYEDVDLGWRIWGAGHRILAAPDAVVHHRSGATSEHLGLFNRGFLFERNAFWTAYKNYDRDHLRLWLPAILWTFLHRTQTLLVQNNPRGELLTLDPYAGWIADTERPGPAHPGEVGDPLGPEGEGLWTKLRRIGLRETVRRIRRRVGFRLAGIEGSAPVLSDPRTVAQLRAATRILGSLDRVQVKRERVQSRRTRSDEDLRSRFPPVLVPTYPGDEELFRDSGFRALLPAEVPWREAALDEIMEWDPAPERTSVEDP